MKKVVIEDVLAEIEKPVKDSSKLDKINKAKVLSKIVNRIQKINSQKSSK